MDNAKTIYTNGNNQSLSLVDQIADIEVEDTIFSKIDLSKIAVKMKAVSDEMSAAQGKIDTINNAGFLQKAWSSFTGKKADALVDVQKVQGELLQLQSVLIMLNIAFAKELNKHQSFVSKQQEVLEEQNNELNSQQKLLDEQNVKIIENQETLISLVSLQSEQSVELEQVKDEVTSLVDKLSTLNHHIEVTKTELFDKVKSLKSVVWGIVTINSILALLLLYLFLR